MQFPAVHASLATLGSSAVQQRLRRAAATLALAASALLLAACSTVKYTVDDGRKVDETLLTQMRTYGAGERALRPAIARTAALKDPACDTQFELPISVASSDQYEATERVAWVRALGVDERLTVIAATEGAGFSLGDKLTSIAGYQNDTAEKMTLALAERRAGPQCARSQHGAEALHELARTAFGERRWPDAAYPYRKAEGMWDAASERCTGEQQQLALKRRAESETDAHNAHHQPVQGTG